MIVLEISVTMAQFPSKEIAQLSYDYRTTRLGFANIGGLLDDRRHPLRFRRGRAICGAISAIMTGICYETSAEMAGELGPFPGYEPNRDHMARVMRNHRLAAHGADSGYEELAVKPVPLDHGSLGDGDLGPAFPTTPNPPGTAPSKRARPTATATPRPRSSRRPARSACVMDCDTTGIEPDFALVKFKKLAGGGYFKIINRAVPEALRKTRL